MDKFVKGENEMWKMPAKEHIQTWIVAASAVKGVLDFRFAPPLTMKMFRQKETPMGYYAAILLYRNVAKHIWRKHQIIKLENAFHIWVNIGYICECTLSAMSSQVTLPCASYRLQFTIATSLCCYCFRAEFHKIGQKFHKISQQHRVYYKIQLFMYLFQ